MSRETTKYFMTFLSEGSRTLFLVTEGNQINEWSMVDTLSPLQARKKIISFALNMKEINLCTMLKFYLFIIKGVQVKKCGPGPKILGGGPGPPWPPPWPPLTTPL